MAPAPIPVAAPAPAPEKADDAAAPAAAADGLKGVPPAGGGLDEFHKLMLARAATQKRNRLIIGAVAAVIIAVVAVKMVQDRRFKAEIQAKLDFAGRWANADKTDTGAFWGCIMGTQVDVGMFSSTDQIQQRVESAYFTQQKTFSSHITNECIPKMERALQGVSGIGAPPAEFAEALGKYKATLPKLQSGIETYAEKIQARAGVKDIDKLIQETGSSWVSTIDPSPEGVAFEKFLNCGIPELQKMKDLQGVLEHMKTACFDKDPVPFMERIRNECGPILTALDKDAKPVPSKTFKATMKKLYEEGDDRILRAWDSCTRRSRKGKKVDDLQDFLLAAGDYMESRHGMVKVARELEALAKGEPLKVEAAPGAPGAAPAAAPEKKAGH